MKIFLLLTVALILSSCAQGQFHNHDGTAASQASSDAANAAANAANAANTHQMHHMPMSFP